ncbi:hypothetical protein HMPREF1475_01104 [Hoylesella oralis HGA0225]|nr:hypothetical protein HMPREF1475_01104 [Hoylesella oralis HGA0225]SHF95250.1 hypothetical protein SAMN05444288_1940 [Hoylesella oralis]
MYDYILIFICAQSYKKIEYSCYLLSLLFVIYYKKRNALSSVFGKMHQE